MNYCLKGKYPVMASWIDARQLPDGRYLVKNCFTTEEYELDENVFFFLRSLDGHTSPGAVGRKYGVDAESLMKSFRENLLVRHGRNISVGLGRHYMTVLIARKQKSKSLFLKLYNMLLLFSWCPVFFYGLHRLRYHTYVINSEYEIIGSLLSILLGALLHEVSHVVACLAYGGRFLEAGFMRKYILPGAYVLLDMDRIKSRLKRTQVHAAGAEMNFLLAGIFMILVSCCRKLSGCFLGAVINNACLAVLNLTFASMLDGNAILIELLGFKSRGDDIYILEEGLEYSKWADMSVNRKVVVFDALIMVAYNVLLLAIMVQNILYLVSIF